MLVVGRSAAGSDRADRRRVTVLGLMLSSQEHHEREPGWLPLGSGPWDGEGRPSWVRLDRVLELRGRRHPAGGSRSSTGPGSTGWRPPCAPTTAGALAPYPGPVMSARTYEVRTYGCQMNVHDSERLSGLLEDAGYVARRRGRGRRRRRRLQHLRGAGERRQPAVRQPRPPRAGQEGRGPACRSPSAAASRRRTAARSSGAAPWVDVVFGTHNIGSLPVLLERARHNEEAQVEILESLEVFPSTLPTRRESPYAAWVSISRRLQQHLHVLHRPGAARQGEGPPARRHPRRGRGAGREGVLEVTLLGQNVNSLRRRVRRPGGLRQAAARLRRDRRPGAGPLHLAAPPRLHRRRHRRDGRDAERDAPAAHAAAVRLGPGAQGDAPLLPAGALPRHHRPGPRRHARRRDHHRHHRRLPRRDRGGLRADPATSCARPASPSAFTFQYSKRPGTPAAEMAARCPRQVVQERYERLVALQEEISWAENKKQVGRTLEVLVAEGEGRKDGATHRLSGRAPDNRLVHFARPATQPPPRPGDVVDGRDHLRRPAPPARRRRRADGRPCAAPAPATPGSSAPPRRRRPAGVLLGLPTVGAPALAPAPRRCLRCAAGSGDRRTSAPDAESSGGPELAVGPRLLDAPGGCGGGRARRLVGCAHAGRRRAGRARRCWCPRSRPVRPELTPLRAACAAAVAAWSRPGRTCWWWWDRRTGRGRSGPARGAPGRSASGSTWAAPAAPVRTPRRPRATLPPSLTVGRWLLDRASADRPPVQLFGVAADAGRERCLAVGAALGRPCRRGSRCW